MPIRVRYKLIYRYVGMMEKLKRTEILVSFGCIFYGTELVECDGRQSVSNSS